MKTNIDLETGDILHCKRGTLLAKLIRLFTKSSFSHSAIVVECWGHTYVVDAQKDGINPRPLEAWLKKYKYEVIVARKDRGIPCDKAYSVKAFSKVGMTGYAFASLLFVHPWATITGKFPKTDPEKDKMVCSEFVAYMEDLEAPYRFTPQDIFEYTMDSEFQHFPFKYDLKK